MNSARESTPIYSWDHCKFAELGYHSGAIYDVQWNCDGTYLASACADKTVKIAALDKSGSARLVQTCSGMTSPRQVCWHPSESSTFAIAGEDKIVELWEVHDQKPKARISTSGGSINIAWSPSGKLLCVGNDFNKLCLVDVGSQLVIPNSTLSMKYEVNQMAWGASGTHIVLASGEGDMGNVDVLEAKVTTDAKGELNADLKVQASVHAHTSNCALLKIDSKKQIMAVSSTDQTVSLWRLDELMCYKSIHFEGIIRCLSFSQDGAYLAISGETFVRVYNTKNAELIKEIDCQRKAMHVAFHPSQAVLIIGTDGKVGAAMRIVNVTGGSGSGSGSSGSSSGVGGSAGVTEKSFLSPAARPWQPSTLRGQSGSFTELLAAKYARNTAASATGGSGSGSGSAGPGRGADGGRGGFAGRGGLDRTRYDSVAGSRPLPPPIDSDRPSRRDNGAFIAKNLAGSGSARAPARTQSAFANGGNGAFVAKNPAAASVVPPPPPAVSAPPAQAASSDGRKRKR